MKKIVWFGLCALAPLWAGGTKTWEMTTFQDFSEGTLQSVAITRDGRLIPAPRLDVLFASDQPAIWAVVQDSSGVIYAGTGNRGRVFRIDSSGKSQIYWSAEEPEVFAISARTLPASSG